jgi:Gpi18-like mannosyltransferase
MNLKMDTNNYLFPIKMWAISRIVVGLLIAFIIPFLSTETSQDLASTHFGWDAFSEWDSLHYKSIVMNGYQYTSDGEGYNVAFFPLYPLSIKILMFWGLSFESAGVLINSLGFLVALILFYTWIFENYSKTIAQWSIAILAWCPFSLFCTVIYTEGLFLFFSISALVFFEKKKYFLASIFGSLSTATRVTGLALIPAFLLASWRQKRKISAYLSAIFSITGIFSYMAYCWFQFHEPLAFLKVQKAWNPSDQSFWGEGWLKMVSQLLFGFINTKYGTLKDPLYIVAMLIIIALFLALWRYRKQWGVKSTYGCFFVIFLLWVLSGNPFINLGMVFGGLYLFWHSRSQLPNSYILYGIFSFLIIFSSGRTASAERYVYAIAPLSLSLGILLDRHARWGYGTIIFFGILLAIYSIRFSQGLWVA